MNMYTNFLHMQFELREMKRRQEEAEAEERARKEAEEAERRAALEAAQAEPVESDKPDAGSPTEEEKPGNPNIFNTFDILKKVYIFNVQLKYTLIITVSNIKILQS